MALNKKIKPSPAIQRKQEITSRLLDGIPGCCNLTVTETSDDSVFYVSDYKNYSLFVEDFHDEVITNIYKDHEIVLAFGDPSIDIVFKKIKETLDLSE